MNTSTTCLNHNIIRSVAVAANIELLLDSDLISLTCNLVEPSIEGGAIVARKAQSVRLHPAGLPDDGEAEFFSDDVTVECPAGVFRFEVEVTPLGVSESVSNRLHQVMEVLGTFKEGTENEFQHSREVFVQAGPDGSWCGFRGDVIIISIGSITF